MVKAGSGPESDKRKRDRKMIAEARTGVGRGQAQVEPRIQAEIGKQLRAIYDDVISEPVPSKFIELLEKLERSTSRKS